MENLSDIKRRINSIKQTRQITGALETVSVSKMRKATARYDDSRSYVESLKKTIAAVMSDESIRETYSRRGTAECGKDLYVVIAADKGMCGAFNHDVFKFAAAKINSGDIVIPIGQTAIDYFDEKYSVARGFAFSSDYDCAKRIYSAVEEAGGVDHAYVVYTRFSRREACAPIMTDILPGAVCTDEVVTNMSAFEPSAQTVCEKLIPLYMIGMIYDALLNSGASEHLARRMAMAAAAESADGAIERLSVEYNRARQAAVTGQITEIIGSTQALDKRRLI